MMTIDRDKKKEDLQKELFDNKLHELNDRRDKQTSRYNKLQRNVFISGTALILIPGLVVSMLLSDTEPELHIVIFSIIYSIFIPFAFLLRNLLIKKKIEEEIQDIGFEIDLLKYHVTSEESRAEKLFRINNVQLRRYYDLNLNQNIWIFCLGVFCILTGVAVICTTLFLLVTVSNDVGTKIITGAVGAIGSLLVNYVAAIYLKIHAEASTNLTSFHSRLVETNQLLLANLLTSRIEDTDILWDTISKISINAGQKIH